MSHKLQMKGPEGAVYSCLKIIESMKICLHCSSNISQNMWSQEKDDLTLLLKTIVATKASMCMNLAGQMTQSGLNTSHHTQPLDIITTAMVSCITTSHGSYLTPWVLCQSILLLACLSINMKPIFTFLNLNKPES